MVSGGTPSTEEASYWNGNVQWFTPTEVGINKYVRQSKRTITELGLKKSSAKLLPAGSILLSTRATVGEASICKQPCTTNQGFQSLVPNGKCNNEFLYYLIQTKKREMMKRSCGSTFNEISNSQVGSIKVNIPSIEQQNKISKFLSLIDERIEVQNKILLTLKSLNKSLYRLFEKDIKIDKLSSICDAYTSTISSDKLSKNGLYPVYGANGLCGYSNHALFNKFGIAIVKDGAGVGRFYKIKQSKYSIIGTMVLLIPKKENDLNYLSLILSSIKFEKYVVGSGIPHIYFNDYKSEKIWRKNEKNAVAANLADLIQQKIVIEQNKLNVLNRQKNYLMINMFI